MIKELEASATIEINGTSAAVWDAMTNPDKIKVYLFGTETVTDWQVGSPIVFRGEYDGHKYQDKGNVLENKQNELLRYSYWSQFSQLEDKPENYSIVTYSIETKSDTSVELIWHQQGFSSEKGHEHTANGLPAMLEQIKKIVEED